MNLTVANVFFFCFYFFRSLAISTFLDGITCSFHSITNLATVKFNHMFVFQRQFFESFWGDFLIQRIVEEYFTNYNVLVICKIFYRSRSWKPSVAPSALLGGYVAPGVSSKCHFLSLFTLQVIKIWNYLFYWLVKIWARSEVNLRSQRTSFSLGAVSVVQIIIINRLGGYYSGQKF